jgi:hypothetical protein
VECQIKRIKKSQVKQNIILMGSNIRLTVPLKKLLNCAETLLEFLEQESDSNFSDILTLRKLRTSIKLKRSKQTKQRFLILKYS